MKINGTFLYPHINTLIVKVKKVKLRNFSLSLKPLPAQESRPSPSVKLFRSNIILEDASF
jgi:hypothetical protein